MNRDKRLEGPTAILDWIEWHLLRMGYTIQPLQISLPPFAYIICLGSPRDEAKSPMHKLKLDVDNDIEVSKLDYINLNQ